MKRILLLAFLLALPFTVCAQLSTNTVVANVFTRVSVDPSGGCVPSPSSYALYNVVTARMWGCVPTGLTGTWTRIDGLAGGGLPNTVVYSNQGTVYLGSNTQDFSQVSLKIPVASGFLGLAGGLIGFDPTTGTYRGGNSGSTEVFSWFLSSITPTSGHCVQWGPQYGQLQDAGASCGTGGGGGGTGTVDSGVTGQVAYYSTTTNEVGGNANLTISSGVLTVGQLATTAGSIVLNGATSGATTLSASNTGGTLNLGSTNAFVDSAGNLTVVGCTGCTSAAGSVQSGLLGQIAYYTANGNTVDGDTNITVDGAGQMTMGGSGIGGSLRIAGSTSGNQTITANADASTLNLGPNATISNGGGLTLGSANNSGSVTLVGATNGSAALTVSAAGGTLSLGSANASVSQTGVITVTGCVGCPIGSPPQSFTVSITGGGSQAITHNLNTYAVIVQCFDATTNKQDDTVVVQRPTLNSVIVSTTGTFSGTCVVNGGVGPPGPQGPPGTGTSSGSGFYQTILANLATQVQRPKLSFTAGSGITLTPSDNGTDTTTVRIDNTAAGFYQVLEVAGTPAVQRTNLNIVAGTNVAITPTDNGSDTTTLTVSASGGSSSANYQTLLTNGSAQTQRSKLNVAAGSLITVTPTDNGTDTSTVTLASTATQNYQTLLANNSPVTQRAKLNVAAGANVTITPTDNGSDTSTFTIASSGGGGSSFYQTMQYNGTVLPQRAKLNVAAGANVTLVGTDNGSDTNTITISSSGGGGGSISSGLLASLPATCTVGTLYFITDQPAGQQLYQCSATNTWTQTLGVGPSGALAVTGGALDIVTGVVPRLLAQNTWAGVNIYQGLLVLQPSGGEPTCSLSVRGSFWFVNGGAAADHLDVCAWTGAAYAWNRQF